MTHMSRSQRYWLKPDLIRLSETSATCELSMACSLCVPDERGTSSVSVRWWKRARERPTHDALVRAVKVGVRDELLDGCEAELTVSCAFLEVPTLGQLATATDCRGGSRQARAPSRTCRERGEKRHQRRPPLDGKAS